jgi:hypothetical protein
MFSFVMHALAYCPIPMFGIWRLGRATVASLRQYGTTNQMQGPVNGRISPRLVCSKNNTRQQASLGYLSIARRRSRCPRRGHPDCPAPWPSTAPPCTTYTHPYNDEAPDCSLWLAPACTRAPQLGQVQGTAQQDNFVPEAKLRPSSQASTSTYGIVHYASRRPQRTSARRPPTALAPGAGHAAVLSYLCRTSDTRPPCWSGSGKHAMAAVNFRPVTIWRLLCHDFQSNLKHPGRWYPRVPYVPTSKCRTASKPR